MLILILNHSRSKKNMIINNDTNNKLAVIEGFRLKRAPEKSNRGGHLTVRTPNIFAKLGLRSLNAIIV